MTSIDSKKIANLPDQIIDADKVRELAKLHRKWGEEGSWAPKTINIHTQIAEILESLLPTPQAEIKLGGWAMHPKHGKVLICSTHADEDLGVRVAVADPPEDAKSGFFDAWVSAADLSPEPAEDSSTPEVHLAPGGVLIQEALDKLNTPEPQVGEAWLVSTREGEQREALKAGNSWYVKSGDDVEEWVEEALIPIARLVPEVAPKVLLTEEDYREAPDGTICAGGMGLPFHTSTRAWRSTSGIRHDHRDLSGTPRRVLRWGMGEQV